MAKEFSYTENDHEIRVWAENEGEVIEEATAALDDEGISLDEESIRERIEVIPSPRRIKSGEEGVMNERRRRGGREAADAVESGMTVGLGTGSTTAWAIAEVGRRVRNGDLENIRGVATSIQSHELAREAGVPLIDLDQVVELDVAIDGADQWDPEHPHVVKGGGASHAREKLIDSMADRLVIATDDDKAQTPLDHPIPLSVLPESRTVGKRWVNDMGGDPELRYAEAKDGPLFTANGNLVIDCDFGSIEDPHDRADALAAIPSAQEHGLFVEMVDEVVYGTDDGVERTTF